MNFELYEINHKMDRLQDQIDCLREKMAEAPCESILWSLTPKLRVLNDEMESLGRERQKVL
ncbi:hypothetical protein [Neptuniibacter caesariensis]|uniref:Uncharacterized protein n=1 Tax=Neptuniibacter caesariensis TaxID=207954 RepID=A0A7U8GTX7_NEPCE|nr:hypothetical protein [Neptuniibacter caesariensis]EAR62803.1 hypothetical protein MED92_06786 [Oceanospirillum sp. MED92] [Neptuniibacter caesariensis]